ncbi:MAG TPA: RNA polymerase sigma factor [Ktedonobacterales bacterium]|nr:RNA polymerase sigma factor [Ktedonobacterales bacterium]
MYEWSEQGIAMRYDDDEVDALLEALATNLADTFPQVVTRYQQALYAFALHLSGSPADAEDLAQEAFIAAYVSLENYPPERIRSLKLRAWLYRVTLNTWRHATRNATRLQLVPLDMSDEPGAANELAFADDPQERPDALLELRERRQELEALVARLPERYRIAIACYYFGEFSYQEVADLLGQPIGTVKSTISRGVRLLRNLLDNGLSHAAARKEA